MKKVKKLILPIVVIAIGITSVALISTNPPQEEQRNRDSAAKIDVEASQVKAQDYNVTIQSYGIVAPKTQTILLSQVSGEIVSVSESFRDGGYFRKGDTLVVVDDRDYKANVEISKAALIGAKVALMEERARGKQAKEDWQRLRQHETPDELALRTPQLNQVKANVSAAEAELRKVMLSLERTEIKAPYNGRVLSKAIDLGQVISNSTQVGEIFAIDVIEVRLPITNEDIELITIPQEFIEGKVGQRYSKVTLTPESNANISWHGEVVRTESVVDKKSQQLYVVAEVRDPFSLKTNARPIKIGQFVNATIEGVTIPNTLVVNNNAIYQGTHVYTIENQELKRTNINIKWQDDSMAVVDAGLKVGDILVKTPLGRVSSGTRVNIINSSHRDSFETANIAGDNND
jgi:RND family efflux transporter MFP subunit